MMDYEPHYGSSLATTKSPGQLRSKNTFQMELDAKMKHRRSMGLTADLTTEDESDDGLGSDDDLLSGFNMTSQPRRQDRPHSAKRREDPMARTTGGSVGGWQPTAAKGKASPRSPQPDNLLAEDILSKKNPYMKSSKASKPHPHEGKGYQEDERPLTKEEIIFGRKSPKGKDTGRRSPQQQRGNFDETGKWNPPSFRKTSTDDLETDARGSPASFGRKTPDHLESISESPKPQPRKRGGKYDQLDDSDDDLSMTSGRPKPKPRGSGTLKEEQAKEREPRGHERATHPKPQQRGTPDIFGTGKKTPNYLLDSDESDEELKKKPRPKTPTKDSDSRKTPTGKKTPTGRLTPTGRQTPPGRLTPTGRRSSPGPTASGKKDLKGRASSPKARADDDDEPRKQASVLDFLMEKEKPKDEKERKAHRRADSKDSISSELMRGKRESPLKDIMNRQTPTQKDRASPTKERVTPKEMRPRTPDKDIIVSSRSRPTSRGRAEERESSLCRDIDRDPEYEANKEKFKEGELQQKKKTQAPQSKERQKFDDAIDQVADLNEETSRTMRYIEPDDEAAEKKNTETQIRPKSASTKKVRPQARYAKPQIELNTPKSERSYDSTASIRQSIFNDWYSQKMDISKQELIEKKRKEKEEEEKKKKDKEDKETESKLAFKAWEEQKKDYLSKKSSEKKKKAKAEKTKEEEEEEKKTEASLAYKSWKQNKDAFIKEKTIKERQEQRKKEREEVRVKEEKLTDSKKLQKRWHEKKETVLTAKERREREAKREAKRREAEEKREKEEEAMESYEKWMENKERQQSRESTRRHASTESIEDRAPWSPAGRTIPFGRA